MNGYPVGEEFALTHVASRSLADSSESSLHVLPLFNLRSGPQILAACRELKPDAVVLQLGHYEAPGPLRKVLKEILLRPTIRKKSGSRETAAQWRPQPELQYRPTPMMALKELSRILAAVLILLSGRAKAMFDSKAIDSSLDSILGALKQLPLRAIVVVGPFSAVDPCVRFFRRIAVPIFENVAKRNHCTFVNVFSFLESYPKGKAFWENFADREHLSVVGHQRVGELVGSALMRALKHATATEVEPAKAEQMRQERRMPSWGKPPVATPHPRPVGAA